MIRKLKTTDGNYNMDIKGLLHSVAMEPIKQDLSKALITYAPGFYEGGVIPGYGTENVFGQSGNSFMPGFIQDHQYTQPANGNVGMNTQVAPDMGQVNNGNYFGDYAQSTDQDIQRQNVLKGLLEAYM